MLDLQGVIVHCDLYTLERQNASPKYTFLSVALDLTVPIDDPELGLDEELEGGGRLW